MKTDTAPLSNEELLTEVVRAMVTDHSAVRVTESREGKTVRLTIHVGARDRGIVIGKEGAAIRSLQDLFMRIGAVDDTLVLVDLERDDRKGGKQNERTRRTTEQTPA